MANTLPIETDNPVAARPEFFPVRLVLAGLVLTLLWFILCRHLSAEWTYNEQYSYGWFVPFFALFLFWLRWERRPRSEIGNGQRALIALAIGIPALLLLLPARLFEIANPDWRPLGWLHATIVVSLTLLVIWYSGGSRWLRHFAFPVAFIFVAVPWVTPIEQPIVQGLMRTIAAIDSELLNVCGIPAQLEGSLIRVSTGLVGVNEACSGVRSLQTSLMIALLFGELNRLTPWRRVVLIFGALFLALAANTARAFVLVWLAATKGLSVMEKRHDLAGYGILVLVFVGSIAFAKYLARSKRGRTPSGAPSESGHSSLVTRHSFLLPPSSFILSLAWLIAIEVAVESWYRMHERNLIPSAQWTVVWPETESGFRKISIDERVRDTLRYDEGGAATWRIDGNSAEAARALSSRLHSLLYFFRWEPGRSSVLRARAHRPDICLPSVGWKQTADAGVRDYPTNAGLALPFRHFEFAQKNEASSRVAFAHAFFCIWQDKTPERFGPNAAGEHTSGALTDWGIPDRFRAVRNGQRELGQQVIEFVLTGPGEISGPEAEQIFSEQIRAAVKPSRAIPPL